MSRKGFWFGLLVGLVVMALLASLSGFVILRLRGTVGPALVLRRRSFGWAPRGWRFGFGFPGRSFGFRPLLCALALLLVFGAVVLIAVFAGHRCWHRSIKRPCSREGQKPSEAETKETGNEPHAEAEHPAVES